jgi:two-component system nitrate/nitrite response regulator NarL
VKRNGIRVVVADDHPIFLWGLVSVLRSQTDLKVLAACPDGATALDAILKYAPNIALLNLRMPRMTGLEVLNEVSKRTLATRVVIVTACIEDHEAALALNRGVYGIITKNSTPKIVIQCLRTVHIGGRFFPTGLIGRQLQRWAEAATINQMLTSREQEVARLVAQGLPNKCVAQHLKISGGTVKLHLHRIYSKTGTSGRSSLADLVLRLGLAQRPTEPRTAAMLEDQSLHRMEALPMSLRGGH